MDPLLVVLVDRVWEDVCLLFDIYEVYRKIDESYRPPLTSFFVALAELLQHGDSYLEEGRKPASLIPPTPKGITPKGSGNFFPDPNEPPLQQQQGLSARRRFQQPRTEEDDADDAGAADLVDFCRVVLTSLLGDLLVFPFWSVKVGAVTGRSRVPGAHPFVAYTSSFVAIGRHEGGLGIWKGAAPMCVVGLMHNFHRIRRALHLDPNAGPPASPPTPLPSLGSSKRPVGRSPRSSSSSRNAAPPPPPVSSPGKKKKVKRKRSKDRLIYTMSERGSLQQRILWSLLLHPLELMSVRMITESRKEYRTWKSSYRYISSGPSGWQNLFFGVRATLLNAIVPYGGWCLVGIPFMIKCRRMLHGQNQDMFQMVRSSLRAEGASGLFCGLRAAVTGLLPSVASLVAARLLVQSTLGTAQRRRRNRAKRKSFYFSLLMKIIPAKDRQKILQNEGDYDDK